MLRSQVFVIGACLLSMWYRSAAAQPREGVPAQPALVGESASPPDHEITGSGRHDADAERSRFDPSSWLADGCQVSHTAGGGRLLGLFLSLAVIGMVAGIASLVGGRRGSSSRRTSGRRRSSRKSEPLLAHVIDEKT